MRTIDEIQDSIIAEKEADATLSAALTSTSKVAVWRGWTRIVAIVMNVLEGFFDAHKADITKLMNEQRPHTLRWYSTIIKGFQIGYTLEPGEVDYTTIDEDAMIITQAAATEIEGPSRVRVKVAKGTTVLTALSTTELTAAREYMKRVKDAGVKVYVTSNGPDGLRLAVDVYYDPLVFNADGERLDGTATTPVMDAMKAYLKALPFNGLLVLERMEDKITAVEGVRIGKITGSQWRYGDMAYEAFVVEKLPDAGYFELDEDYFTDNVTYISHPEID